MEKRYYDVYHNNMIGAKVYNRNSEKDEVANASAWAPLRQDPLIDTVVARDQNEALRIVSAEHGFHRSNLYAKEHAVKSEIHKKHKRRTEILGTFSAYAFENDTKSGIEITLPNGKKL